MFLVLQALIPINVFFKFILKNIRLNLIYLRLIKKILRFCSIIFYELIVFRSYVLFLLIKILDETL